MSFLSDIFGGGDSPQVVVPEKSPEELSLLREQTNVLRQQQEQLTAALKQQDLLRPLLFGELGIREVRDAAGNVTGFEKAPLNEEQTRIADITKKLQERTAAALDGTLPVDPGLERELEQGRRDLAESLRKQLGPGWETSTPGIQALAEFDKRAAELHSSARTGQLTLAEQLAGAREARTTGTQFQTLNDVMATSQGKLPFINSGTSLAAAFNGPLSNMANDRMAAANASFQNANIQATSDRAFMGGIGQLAGMAMFAPTGGTAAGGSMFSKIFS